MINIEDTFTPKVVPASEDYPFGSIKPNSAQGADDGTRLAAVWGNDYEGFRQKAMSDANLIPNGAPDTATNSQLLDAIDVRYRHSNWVPTVTEIGAAPSSHVGSTGDAHGVATQLVNGFISSTDKIKLDGIAQGANVGVVPNSTINSGTHTKITYDEKGLIISGTDATTADILESTDKKYVSDSEKINIGNLSGINSGDETKDSIEVKLSGSSIVTTQGNTFNGNSELVQTTADGKLPPLDGSNLINLPSTTGTGESNTASNYGTSGTGLFDSKSGVDLRFKNIDSESGKISITTNEINHTVNLGVNLVKSDVGLGNVTNVEQLPLAYLDIDTNLTANSDTKVPSQKATKAYADTKESLLPSAPIAPESKFLNANKQWATISHSYTTDKNLEEDYQHINNTDRQNLNNLSGTNTGDETSSTILAKIGDGSKISSTYLPSYVDDVLEYTNLAAFPTTGEAGKIYVALDTNKTYRWSGSAYVYITSGAVDSVAGKTGVVTLVKADVGLSNVDNTSDINKPISTAQQSALDLKANLASPALTGTPSAPTATVGTSTTQIATTAFVNAEIANDAAPSSHVGSTGNTHGVATTSVAGFMSAADKTKLNGIAAGANVYTHPDSGVTAGTYKSVTVDAKGHVTAGTNPTTLAGYGITDALTDAPSDGKTYARKNAAWSEITSGGGSTTVLWANRPSASLTPGGEIIISDLGYQKMYSDGTNWRPVGGRLRLRSQRGLKAAPIATLTGPGLFAVPGGAVVIPAGLLTSDAAVTVQAEATETSGTSGILQLTAHIGTVNTGAGSNQFALANISSGTGGQFAVSTCIKFASSTTATTRRDAGCGANAVTSNTSGTANVLSIIDLTTKLDTSSVMYVNVGAYSNVDGAVSKLVTYDVFVEM